MKRLLIALVFACAGFVGIATPAEAAGDPVTCVGYPEPRTFLEAQQWWQPTLNGTENLGHVHMGMCFPRQGVHVSGTVHFDFIVQLHENPGVLQNIRIHLLDGNGQNHQVVSVKVNQTAAQHCPATPDQCTWTIPIDLNTTVSTTDGYQNIRPAAIVMHPNQGGTKRFAGSAWPMYLENGKPVKNSIASTRIAGSSWYTGALYGEAEFLGIIPDAPVSGTWTPTVWMHPGAGGKTVKRSFVSIDPAFHAVPPYPGMVVLDQPSSYKGPVSIDTTQLSNGLHKLFIRADAPCSGATGNDCGKKPNGTTNNTATHSSVQVIQFTVAN